MLIYIYTFYFIFSRILKGNEKAEWIALHNDPSFKKYAMMSHSPCGRLVVIGSIDGHLLIVSTESAFEVMEYKLKIILCKNKKKWELKKLLTIYICFL